MATVGRDQSLPARYAVEQYRRWSRRLRLETDALRDDPRKPLTRRIIAARAEVARRATVAEMDDPEPSDESSWCQCRDCITYLGRNS